MRRPTAELIIIGKEITSGLRQDRNVLTLARFLGGMGIRVCRVSIVGDELRAIRGALREARRRTPRPDLVMTTGGLGSTRDDMTVAAISAEWRAPMRLIPEMNARLREKLAARGRALMPRYLSFARLPRGATPLENPVGMAEGILIGSRPVVVALPGVPRELNAMLSSSLAPALHASFSALRPRKSHIIGVAGMSEGDIEDLFLNRNEFRRGRVSILPSSGIVYLVTTSSALWRLIVRRIGAAVFTTTGETPEAALAHRLSRRKETLATAESCTGGLLAELITSVPGASHVFMGGMTVYHNAMKMRWLGVPRRVLERHGAVSEQCALALARGIRRAARSDWALSITGIAGPTGGSMDKPVGTVCIGLSGPRRAAQSARHLFMGDRAEIRLRATRAAMELLRRALR